MRFVLLLTLFLLPALFEHLAAQERIAYRVEVIILRLVQSDFPPEAVEDMQDYSSVFDFEDYESRRTDWLNDLLLMNPVEISEIPVTPPLTVQASRYPAPEGLIYFPEMSEQMSTVWRNLRLSAEYRPEVYLSWQQDAEGEFPPLRLHNAEVLSIDDPFVDQRVTLIAEPDSPAPKQNIFTYDFPSGTLALNAIPDETRHFVLDGSIRMRRSRFLHIDLDVEYRTPSPALLEGVALTPLQLVHQGYLIQPLRQSRQIRTGRMEYFDAPVLGALIWVTAIEEPADESTP